MYNELDALTKLLTGLEEEQDKTEAKKSTTTSHALTPADLARIGERSGLKTAVPNAVRVPKPSTTSIWDDNEILSRDAIHSAEDGRKRPLYEILIGQHVGTEDVYLGMSDKTPSSLHCDRLVIRIALLGERLSDVDLDVTEDKVTVQSPL